jgi:2-dehydro-3-deoxygluconokinase
MVSVLPDNAIGQAALDELRRYGVGVAGVRRVPGRMGLYFLDPGAGLRPAQVLYDRAGSAFANAAPELVDWGAELAGAGWLHVSGVTPAIGANAAAAALRAVRAARAAGVAVSFDCNYRATLWQAWDGDGPAILRAIMAEADLVFGDHRDVALILGRTFAGAGEQPRTDAASAAFESFPNLQRMASTRRVQHSVDAHDLSAFLFARDGAWTTPALSLTSIVDRIGAGDAFAAGLLHGFQRGMDPQSALEFALAATALKHSIPGDFNLATEAQIEALASGAALDVRR